MTNPTHLMHLKQHSVEHWNRWRTSNPSIKPNLSGAYLCAAALGAANLSHALLRKSDLYSADLWCADLSDADARDANLSSANLIGANFVRANLSGAELLNANLSQADLKGANLHHANLSMTNLSGANLVDTDLTGANLRGAKLTNANLNGARLAGADLTGIMVTDLDIGFVATLEQVTCDHIYVISCISPEDQDLENTYTNHFREALHQFYQNFVEFWDKTGPQHYQITWPSSAMATAPDAYLQAIEHQEDGGFLVRVGVPSLKSKAKAVEASVEKPNYQQLFSTLGRGDYYRQQLQLKEEQLVTYQRQNNELLELLKSMTRQNVYVQSVSVLENSIMTGVSKYDLRGANIGSFADTVAAGGQQQAIQHNQRTMDTVPDLGVVTEMEQIFQHLAAKAAQVPAHQRPQVVANVLQKKSQKNPEFKARLLKAVESGSAEMIRVFTQNPYVSIPMALVKGWAAAG